MLNNHLLKFNCLLIRYYSIFYIIIFVVIYIICQLAFNNSLIPIVYAGERDEICHPPDFYTGNKYDVNGKLDLSDNKNLLELDPYGNRIYTDNGNRRFPPIESLNVHVKGGCGCGHEQVIKNPIPDMQTNIKKEPIIIVGPEKLEKPITLEELKSTFPPYIENYPDVNSLPIRFKFTKKLIMFLNDPANNVIINNAFINSHNVNYNAYLDPLTPKIFELFPSVHKSFDSKFYTTLCNDLLLEFNKFAINSNNPVFFHAIAQMHTNIGIVMMHAIDNIDVDILISRSSNIYNEVYKTYSLTIQ